MTGFSPEWLALREPADTVSRNQRVLAACRQAFAARESLAVCDLGAGTGASLRAFAEMLPKHQSWRLVDNDEINLSAAVPQLVEWAGRTESDGTGVVLFRDGIRLEVETIRHDLATSPRCWADGTDLVVASALFDLASENWIANFVSALAEDRLPVLATLTFDGAIALDPPHRMDAAIAGTFGEHQKRDKGFGPAAGGRAPAVLAAHLRKAGYSVTVGASLWRIGLQWGSLRAALVEGIATAVTETGLLGAKDVTAWTAACRQASAILVGHRDVFATPRRS